MLCGAPCQDEAIVALDVRKWLEGLSLGKYAATFIANDVDQDVLHDLDESDLERLGVSLGHRKKLLRAIADLEALPKAVVRARREDNPAASFGEETENESSADSQYPKKMKCFRREFLSSRGEANQHRPTQEVGWGRPAKDKNPSLVGRESTHGLLRVLPRREFFGLNSGLSWGRDD